MRTHYVLIWDVECVGMIFYVISFEIYLFVLPFSMYIVKRDVIIYVFEPLRVTIHLIFAKENCFHRTSTSTYYAQSTQELNEIDWTVIKRKQSIIKKRLLNPEKRIQNHVSHSTVRVDKTTTRRLFVFRNIVKQQ
jgi:hypothetical protein